MHVDNGGIPQELTVGKIMLVECCTLCVVVSQSYRVRGESGRSATCTGQFLEDWRRFDRNSVYSSGS